MHKNATAMNVPVDRFMGLAELRDETRWQDEYDAFTDEQKQARERSPIRVNPKARG